MMAVSSVDRPVSPGLTSGGLALAMLLVLALLALTVRQPPPPPVAEFAPQAVEQIKKAPVEQSAEAGSAEGGTGGREPGGVGGGGGAGGDGAGGIPEIDTRRVRRCVGNPPRQIEDPQSPPCVPYFEGDNGGSTYKGVTRDEIRVVSPADNFHTSKWVKFFNERFEFYGRKITLVEMATRDGEGTFAGSNEANMQADAVRVDQEFGAFASLSYPDRHGKEFAYYDELARRGIVSVNVRAGIFTEERLRRNHPYQWSWLPGTDVILSNKATWVCRSLKDRPSEFADGLQRRDKRVFGLIVTTHPDGTAPDLGEWRRILSACGVSLAAEARIVDDPNSPQQSQARNAVAAMQEAGVTSVLCECYGPTWALAMVPAASNQGYLPEWVMSTFIDGDLATAAEATASYPEQFNNTFGISFRNKQNRPADSPWQWALQEQDPNFAYCCPPQDFYVGQYWSYPALLLLASGIQLAGPNLTPETFAQGLQRAKFPNPGAGGLPFFQAFVGFPNNTHSMVQDAAVYWGNITADNQWGTRGGWCFARRGERYANSRKPWPDGYAGLYQPPCR